MSVAEIREAVRADGLLAQAPAVVAMLSGGRDSVCLLDLAVALRGGGAVSALHVNYRLREDADADERHCAQLCEALGVELSVVRAEGAPDAAAAAAGPIASGAPEGARGTAAGAPGNLQAWARDVRYCAARAEAERRGAWIATGHTASDQVETILYRLAASPGRRALLGMAAAQGRLIRPLLAVTREQTAAYCVERGLRWREDSSNEDERYARARVRSGLVPALRAVHPAAESNVLRTAQLLREETELLDGLVAAELADGAQIALARLAELPAALARMVVVRLAEEAAGTYVPQAGERVGELLALGARGGRAELHLGALAAAVIDGGVLSMRRLAPGETSQRRRAPPGAD
ncbi:MAG: tRNA(Ile)-lysidine synthase [Solirubrobacteraceae bacterium]|nr:tRNA(Ile)-lysidine synthase [Solirubrobacteraceae bacterium]